MTNYLNLSVGRTLKFILVAVLATCFAAPLLASAQALTPNLTNNISFEAKATDGAGNTTSDWTNQNISVAPNGKIFFRWNASDYVQCRPELDGTTYSYAYTTSRSANNSFTTGNTEQEGYTIPVNNGTFKIDCGPQNNNEEGMDSREITVTVQEPLPPLQSTQTYRIKRGDTVNVIENTIRDYAVRDCTSKLAIYPNEAITCTWGSENIIPYTEIPGPTNLTASCNSETSVTLSWTNGVGSQYSFPRIQTDSQTSQAECPTGYTWESRDKSCYLDNLEETTLTYPVQTNTNYSWWVHSSQESLKILENGASNASLPTSGQSFTCSDSDTTSLKLTSSVKSGSAPLTVEFTVQATDSTPESGVYYTISFGDQDAAGFDRVSNPTVSHTYTSEGLYPAMLVRRTGCEVGAKDCIGSSKNLNTVVIDVSTSAVNERTGFLDSIRAAIKTLLGNDVIKTSLNEIDNGDGNIFTRFIAAITRSIENTYKSFFSSSDEDRYSDLPVITKNVSVSILSISDGNPLLVNGSATDVNIIGVTITSADGTKKYESDEIYVNNSKWSHRVNSDMEIGNYLLTVYVDNAEVDSQNFTITDATNTLAGIKPSNLSVSCNGDTSATLSWLNAIDSQFAFPRIQSFVQTSQAECPDGYTWRDPYTCFQDNSSANSITYPVVPGTLYGWWVHSSQTPLTNAEDWSEASDVTMGKVFSCPVVAGQTAATDTYKVYFDNTLGQTSIGITREEAVSNCAITTSNNPSKTVRCTWGSEELVAYSASIPSPTNLAVACNTDSTVTLDWDNGIDSQFAFPRVQSASQTSQANCPTGYTWHSPNTCYLDDYHKDTLTYPVIPGEKYTWWVHSSQAPLAVTNGVSNASLPTGGTDFTCNSEGGNNQISFEARVTDEAGNTIKNWSSASQISINRGQELAFRWDASNYKQCLPFLADYGRYSLEYYNNDTTMVTGDTELSEFNVFERTGEYRLECEKKNTGTYEVDASSIFVKVN